jgi:hypothetical protein
MELLSSTGNMCSGLNWFAGCPDGSPAYEYNPNCDLGLVENEIKSVLFYPNPVTDKLHFNLNETTGVKLFSITGELLKEEKCTSGENEMNLSEFATGLYLVTVLGKSYQIIKR